jgi:hypothetical protein
MDHLQVQEYTLRFLQHGYFVSEESRQRLEAETSKPGDTP